MHPHDFYQRGYAPPRGQGKGNHNNGKGYANAQQVYSSPFQPQYDFPHAVGGGKGRGRGRQQHQPTHQQQQRGPQYRPPTTQQTAQSATGQQAPTWQPKHTPRAEQPTAQQPERVPQATFGSHAAHDQFIDAKHKAILDDTPEAYHFEITADPQAQGPGATPFLRNAWKTERLGWLRKLAAQISTLQDAQQDTRQLAIKVSIIKRELLDNAEPHEQLAYIRDLKDCYALGIPHAHANLINAQTTLDKIQMKATVYSRLEAELYHKIPYSPTPPPSPRSARPSPAAADARAQDVPHSNMYPQERPQERPPLQPLYPAQGTPRAHSPADQQQPGVSSSSVQPPPPPTQPQLHDTIRKLQASQDTEAKQRSKIEENAVTITQLHQQLQQQAAQLASAATLAQAEHRDAAMEAATYAQQQQMRQHLQHEAAQHKELHTKYEQLRATYQTSEAHTAQLRTAGQRLEHKLQEADTAQASAAQEVKRLNTTTQQAHDRATLLQQQLVQANTTLQKQVTDPTANQHEQTAARLQQEVFNIQQRQLQHDQQYQQAHAKAEQHTTELTHTIQRVEAEARRHYETTEAKMEQTKATAEHKIQQLHATTQQAAIKATDLQAQLDHAKATAAQHRQDSTATHNDQTTAKLRQEVATLHQQHHQHEQQANLDQQQSIEQAIKLANKLREVETTAQQHIEAQAAQLRQAQQSELLAQQQAQLYHEDHQQLRQRSLAEIAEYEANIAQQRDHIAEYENKTAQIQQDKEYHLQERKTAQMHFDLQLAKATRALAEAQENELHEQAALQLHKDIDSANDEQATLMLRNARQDLRLAQETMQEEELLARRYQQDTQKYATDCKNNLDKYEESQAMAQQHMQSSITDLEQQLASQRALNAQLTSDAARFDEDLKTALLAKAHDLFAPTLPPPIAPIIIPTLANTAPVPLMPPAPQPAPGHGDDSSMSSPEPPQPHMAAAPPEDPPLTPTPIADGITEDPSDEDFPVEQPDPAWMFCGPQEQLFETTDGLGQSLEDLLDKDRPQQPTQATPLPDIGPIATTRQPADQALSPTRTQGGAAPPELVYSSPEPLSPTVHLTPRPAEAATMDLTPERPLPQRFALATGETPSRISEAEQMETTKSYDALDSDKTVFKKIEPLSVQRKQQRTGRHTASRSPSRTVSQMHPDGPDSPRAHPGTATSSTDGAPTRAIPLDDHQPADDGRPLD